MQQTLLMERVCGRTRLAVIEEGKLCEMHVEEPGGEDNLTGSVYLGRVENVLPGMNAAFIDIGLEKNAFLAAADVAQADGTLPRPPQAAPIEKRLRPGQEALVRISKAATGEKGHRVTTQITLPGRAMVLLSEGECVNISRKIEDDQERARLSSIMRAKVSGTGLGVIVRTAAEGENAEALGAEFDQLRALWGDISRLAAHARAPKLICNDQSLALRAVRDRLREHTEALWTDDPALYEELRGLAETFAPKLIGKIRLHDTSTPLFDIYRVDEQLDRGLCRQVRLKSGGTLVIDETEALTVIDVNTGKYTGRRDPEETVFSNNCEAAEEIMRLLRLREIGGIVVVDFIDMKDAGHKQALLQMLRELARRDSSSVNVVGITALGLVEMTRHKARQPLNRQFGHACPVCGGSGWTPTPEISARRIQREIWRRRRGGDQSPLLVEASAAAAGALEKLGAPEGGVVYLRAAGGLRGGDHRISPVDEGHMSADTTLLK